MRRAWQEDGFNRQESGFQKVLYGDEKRHSRRESSFLINQEFDLVVQLGHRFVREVDRVIILASDW